MLPGHSSSLWKVKVGTQGKDLAEATIEGRVLLACSFFWLAHWVMLSFFLYNPGPSALPRNGTAHSGPGPLIWINNQGNHPQTCPKSKLLLRCRQFLNRGFPVSWHCVRSTVELGQPPCLWDFHFLRELFIKLIIYNIKSLMFSATMAEVIFYFRKEHFLETSLWSIVYMIFLKLISPR